MVAPKPKRHCLQATPDRFVFGLAVLGGFLLLSERFSWLPFNEKKGYTVLVAVAAVCVGLLVLFLWFGLSLVLRRRFQFGLRSLLAMVLLVAVACSWLGVKVEQARKQKAVVEALKRHCVIVEYTWVYDNRLSFLAAPGPAPIWLRELLGEDFFHDVIEVKTCGDTGFRDDDLAYVAELTSLRSLMLFRDQVTDTGLEHLQGLTHLRQLFLDGTQITDEGLVHLKGLTSLVELSLWQTKVTDEGLEHLKELPNLTYLYLEGTQVTDAGVEGLQEALPKLHVMSR